MDAFEACEAMVKAADPDRYIAALFAPAARRRYLFALYAFNLEIAKVAEAVRQPMLGEIRLQWWRETLEGARAGKPRTHDVARALADTFAEVELPAALFDAMVEVMGYQLNWTRHTGIDQQPLGMSSPAVAPYGSYRTADGQIVVMGTTNDIEWQRLARRVIERPDLAEDKRLTTNTGRVQHREELDAAIGAWCARRDLAQIQRVADDE